MKDFFGVFTKTTFTRLFKWLLPVLAILFLLSACSKNSQDADCISLELWGIPNFTSETGIQGDFEKRLIAAFEKENPSIKIKFTLIDFADANGKFEDAINKKKAPDIVYDSPGRIIGWANRGLLEPLDDVLAQEKPYITTALLSISRGEDRKTYMYPMHEVPFSMAFNKEMLDDLGILDLLPYKRRDRQWTVLEYETLLKALREKLPKNKTPCVFYYKTQGGDQGTRAFLVNLYGDANLMNGDYTKYIFNSQGAVKNLQWAIGAIKQGWFLDGANLDSNDAIAMFVNSKAAHTILYSPQLDKINDGKRNYKGKDFTPIYMPFPNNSGIPLLEFLAGGACVFKTDDPAKLLACKKFLHFAATNKTWAPRLVHASGGFPVSSKIKVEMNDDEILYNSVLIRFFGQYYNNIEGFAEMRRNWNTALKEAGKGMDIQTVLNNFVQKSNSSLNKD